MQSITRTFRWLQFVLLALIAVGCASAVDESLPTPEEATASASAPLKGEVADSADCELSESAAVDDSDDYEEVSSILESMSMVDGADDLEFGGCRRFCKCCKGGNRFCCKHCDWCSGPIGPRGLSTALAP